MQKSWKLSAVVLVLCLAVLMSGCYGTFSLTKRLHHWNGEQDGRWGQEGIFLLLVIVPVYGICTLADALIFNAIEFWGGNNPIAGTAMAPATGASEPVAATAEQPAGSAVAAATR